MELNTINKTGTWSETADRINSNFSKISIEVEEIKQNGGGGSGASMEQGRGERHHGGLR